MKKVNLLSNAEMKKVMGGVLPACGIKVNGTWCSIEGGAATAEGQLGTYTTCGGGTIAGTVTNWCCASCYWND